MTLKHEIKGRVSAASRLCYIYIPVMNEVADAWSYLKSSHYFFFSPLKSVQRENSRDTTGIPWTLIQQPLEHLPQFKCIGPLCEEAVNLPEIWKVSSTKKLTSPVILWVFDSWRSAASLLLQHQTETMIFSQGFRTTRNGDTTTFLGSLLQSLPHLMVKFYSLCQAGISLIPNYACCFMSFCCAAPLRAWLHLLNNLRAGTIRLLLV